MKSLTDLFKNAIDRMIVAESRTQVIDIFEDAVRAIEANGDMRDFVCHNFAVQHQLGGFDEGDLDYVYAAASAAANGMLQASGISLRYLCARAEAFSEAQKCRAEVLEGVRVYSRVSATAPDDDMFPMLVERLGGDFSAKLDEHCEVMVIRGTAGNVADMLRAMALGIEIVNYNGFMREIVRDGERVQ